MSKQPNRHEDSEFNELLIQYQNLIAGYPHSFIDEEAFGRIVDYYDDTNELTRALEAADVAINQYPLSGNLMVKKADLLIVVKKYREALRMLERAESLSDEDINIYILKADAYLALNQPERAEETMQEALGKFDGYDKIDLLFELSDVFDDYEDFEKVFDCLKIILELDPTNEEALNKICFWTEYTGRNEESILLHRAILDDHPFSELAWFNLAAAYQGLKLYEKAIDAYQFAIAIDEKFEFAYRNLADAYIRTRKFTLAIEALQTVLELAQPEEVILEAIGHCYDKLNDYATARTYYRRALHQNPEDSMLFYKIAGTYMSEGEWNKAINHLKTALRLSKYQTDYNLAMGQCLVQLEQYADAMPYLGLVVSMKPKNLSGWMTMLQCLYRGGYYEEGLQALSEEMPRSIIKPVFHLYKAAFLFAVGRAKDAQIFLEHGMAPNARLIKKLNDLDPAILKSPQILDAVARTGKKI